MIDEKVSEEVPTEPVEPNWLTDEEAKDWIRRNCVTYSGAVPINPDKAEDIRLYRCPTCSARHNTVGTFLYDGRMQVHGISALFVPGGHICNRCEATFKRTKGTKLPPSAEERRHAKNWKKFLAYQLYPEISVIINANDGSILGRTAKV